MSRAMHSTAKCLHPKNTGFLARQHQAPKKPGNAPNWVCSSQVFSLRIKPLSCVPPEMLFSRPLANNQVVCRAELFPCLAMPWAGKPCRNAVVGGPAAWSSPPRPFGLGWGSEKSMLPKCPWPRDLKSKFRDPPSHNIGLQGQLRAWSQLQPISDFFCVLQRVQYF